MLETLTIPWELHAAICELTAYTGTRDRFMAAVSKAITYERGFMDYYDVEGGTSLLFHNGSILVSEEDGEFKTVKKLKGE
jgi:hypothetical protein